jgi:hypothetical protein
MRRLNANKATDKGASSASQRNGLGFFFSFLPPCEESIFACKPFVTRLQYILLSRSSWGARGHWAYRATRAGWILQGQTHRRHRQPYRNFDFSAHLLPIL